MDAHTSVEYLSVEPDEPAELAPRVDPPAVTAAGAPTARAPSRRPPPLPPEAFAPGRWTAARDASSAPSERARAAPPDPLLFAPAPPADLSRFRAPELPAIALPPPPPRSWRRRARVGAFHWTVFLAAVALSSAVSAGGVEFAWWARHRPVAVATPKLDTPAPAPAPRATPPRVAHVAPPAAAGASPRAQLERATAAPLAAPARAARASTPVAPPRALATTARPAGTGPDCVQRCGTNVACILACPYQGLPPGHGLVNPTPTGEQLALAMRQVQAQVLWCAVPRTDAPAEARVAVTFAPDGAVRAARAQGLDPSLAACVERAVARAHVPAFSAPAGYTATHAFSLR